ncbi:SMP-30/gluconolactonase/LRE family protein [Kordiimonas aestuarii]|uniref:hypothetical protein n=1 Tax=Kordiimonas aestuarii TaxID=1005925 RepID=UPI0021CFDA57|nr:hypothetical protein [Kordiimonas aestuarii]
MFRITIFATLLGAFLIAPCGQTHADHATIRHIWTVDAGLFEPESVAMDEERNVIYVSNVVGYGQNGKGYISRLSMSGRMIDEKWIEGLNAPTGMALYGNSLYFADYNQLVKVDVTTREITGRYPAPDPEPCLNDVAIAEDGTVYVSGSCRKAVYRLDNDALTPFIDNPTALNLVNGLYVARDMLLTGGWQIWIWDRVTGEPLAEGPVTLQDNVRDIDGIAWDGEAFIFSMVNDRRLWRLGADGIAVPISEETFDAVDFQYDYVTGLLIMPRIPADGTHKVSAYRLTFQ